MSTNRAHQKTVLAQRRAAVPDRSVWVSASAGTGKTKVLTDRVLSLLLAGTPPQRILCLTFTRAAAAEMSNRINDRLGDWAADEKELEKGLADLLGHVPDAGTRDLARRLFAMVLDVPGGMKIQTIHSFCESLLHRFPLEAGLAPHFDVMDERTAIEALHAARDVVLARARHGDDAALAAALAELARRVNEVDFAELLRSLAAERGRLRRMLTRHGGISGYRAALYGLLEVGEGETDDGIIAAAGATGAFDEVGLRRACKALSEGSKTDTERGVAIADWLADAAAREAGLGAYARVFLTADGGVRKTLITKAAAAAPNVADILATEAARLQAVDDRRRALATAQATAALVALGWAWLDAYDAYKLAHARLDYDDLILGARALLEEDGAAAWVLYKLDGGIDHILIDEAQDTNPDQWAVVRALAEEFFAGEGAREVSRTVFAVGDAKQSIYSFQRADPQSFAHMQDHFRQRVMAAERKWDNVDLTLSFRSTPAVLDAVDTVFAEHPARTGVAMAGEKIVHTPHREGQAGLVELWPAVEPKEAEVPEPWAQPVQRRPVDSPQTRLARVIAGRIGCWLDQGEMLESRNRPVRAGDIMVLVRRRTGFVDALIRALKHLNVPVAGIDRMVLSDQIAVKDLIVLGEFLLLPEDDLTLATVLKGPLFGVNEEDLFQLAHGRAGTLWQELGRRAGKQPWRRAHGELADLLGRADFVPPFELYADVLSRRGARLAITGRLGRDAGDPIDEFLSLALGFERNNAPSLQAFLHWIGAGEAEIKRDLEHGVRDEVRVMTVHGAKGLQAPIVFLPDTMQAPSRSPRLLWQGAGDVLLWRPRRAFDGAVSRALRDEARLRADEEYRRLLYVAMTRAEDRLYICGWHTRNSAPEHCWYNMAAAALGPSAEAVEMDFTDDARDDGWQGAGLRLANKQDSPAEESDHGRRYVPPPDEPPAWARTPAPPEDIPPRPLVPSRPDELEPATRSPVGADRGAAFRRGNLIHRLLQTLPEIAPAERAAAARRYLALPAHGLVGDQGQELEAEVLAVLSAPDFADLFGPGSRAEVPLTGCINHRVISGQVDRLVVEDGRVRIIDFKSNRPPPTLIQDTPVLYLRQMAAYRAVLAEIYPDFSIDCAILWTDGPTLMGLPDALLSNYAP